MGKRTVNTPDKRISSGKINTHIERLTEEINDHKNVVAMGKDKIRIATESVENVARLQEQKEAQVTILHELLGEDDTDKETS